MATHSSILAWRTPCPEVPGGLQSMGLTKSWTQLKRLGSHSEAMSAIKKQKVTPFVVGSNPCRFCMFRGSLSSGACLD